MTDGSAWVMIAKRGADVRVRAEPLHNLQRILVRITTRKADEVHVVGAGFLHDEPRDVVRAFDQVRHRDDVADALAAVRTQVSQELGAAHACFATKVRPDSSV